MNNVIVIRACVTSLIVWHNFYIFEIINFLEALVLAVFLHNLFLYNNLCIKMIKYCQSLR